MRTVIEMGSIIIRKAVQEAWDEAQRREQQDRELRIKHDLNETRHPHSPEALEALKAWGRPGGILLPATNADWWCWGFDAARKADQ